MVMNAKNIKNKSFTVVAVKLFKIVVFNIME